MPRQLNSKQLYIVCEGEKTEVSFFTDLQTELKNEGIAVFDQVDFYKVPKPENIAGKLDNKESRPTGGRTLLNNANIEHTADNYEPLNWIKIANKHLLAYSEAWAVFDNDHRNSGQSNIDRAFDQFKNFRQAGFNIHLAYSSLSFEYYMLQHFECLYKSFNKTECYINDNGSHKYLECCSEAPKEGACDGILENDCCINGYARKKGYWEKSKTTGTLYVVKNIFTGIINSYKIRLDAFCQQRNSTLGDMNPYLNTYALTLRMMGYEILDYLKDIEIRNKSLRLDGNNIVLTNNSSTTFILSGSCQKIYRPDPNSLFGKEEVGRLNRIVVNANAVVTIDISSISDDHFAILEVEDKRIIVCPPYEINPRPTDEEKEKHLLE